MQKKIEVFSKACKVKELRIEDVAHIELRISRCSLKSGGSGLTASLPGGACQASQCDVNSSKCSKFWLTSTPQPCIF